MAKIARTPRRSASRRTKNADDAGWAPLRAAAIEAAANAHAPYSQFRVGAAVEDEQGRVFSGCNVENASYGLTLCAERNAVAAAVRAGAKRICRVLVFTPTPTPTPPCGACRQVLREFGVGAAVRSCCASKKVKDTTVEALLPESFGPEQLG